MRIAVLEDDAEQNRFLTAVLSAAGYSVHTFMNGRALAAKLTHESFDLLILDWQVPDLSGYEVLRKVRAQFGNQTPVLFITHRDAEEDIVLALQAGADDYVVKPPRPQEIIARVAALIRRAQPALPEEPIDLPPYRIEPHTRTVAVEGKPVDLTQKEFDLALFLFRNREKLISRDHLLEVVWGKGLGITTRTVDTHVSKLRGKLDIAPRNGFRLTSVYGYGYRLESVSEGGA